MNKMLLSHLSGPIFPVFVRFFVRILLIGVLAVGLSGCYITIYSITVPSTALLGQTITIVLQGSGSNDDPFTSPNGLVLQIPIGTEVVSPGGLTPDSSITAGYTAEPGYHLWGGKQDTSPGGPGSINITKIITLKINDTVTPGTYYIKAAVRGFVGGAWTDMAPGPTDFSEITDTYQSNPMDVTATGIGIASPAGGETWYKGLTYPVSWIYLGDVGSAVDIELYQGTSLISTAATDVPIGGAGSGDYDWLIPSNVGIGSNYQMKITSTSNGSYSVLSPFFVIDTPYIQLSGPNGGNTLFNGIVHQVQWTYLGLDGTTVDIDLYKGGSYSYNLVCGIEVGSGGSGSYEWEPDEDAGTDYQIKVTSTADSSVNDLSDNNFSILDCPNDKVWMTTGATAYYDSIQAAYEDDDAAIGSVRDINAQAATFSGNLLMDDEKTITLKGGYDCGYGSNAGYTTIYGNMTVSGGSVVVDNLIISVAPAKKLCKVPPT